MEELLIIHDEYAEGKINLEEAIKMSKQHVDLSDDSLRKILSEVERDNVVNLFE